MYRVMFLLGPFWLFFMVGELSSEEEGLSVGVQFSTFSK
jgi:hypothetical protein